MKNNPLVQKRIKVVSREKQLQETATNMKIARELVAYAIHTHIELSFPNDGSVGFTPADAAPQKFIEQVTILRPFVKVIYEQTVK